MSYDTLPTEALVRAHRDSEQALRLAAYHGVPLPRAASDALRDLQNELRRRRTEAAPGPDPFGALDLLPD